MINSKLIKQKKKHICRFIKVSEKVEEINLGDEWKEMFGINIKSKETMKRFVTIFKCKCGKTQRFIDEENGAWNKTLPSSFMLPIHK